MNLVAAIVDGGEVHYGGDMTPWEIETTGWKASAVGEARYRQICQHAVAWPTFGSNGIGPSSEPDVLTYLVRDLVPALMTALERGACIDKKEARCKGPGQMLIVAKKGLYIIDSDFEVLGPGTYACIGPAMRAGAAHGAFFATEGMKDMPAKKRLELALKAAQHPDPR